MTDDDAPQPSELEHDPCEQRERQEPKLERIDYLEGVQTT